ncbi:hypothetical protein [Streptomyces sp. E1N211]|uniref:hypothetical protein n=1 Tax=Streptomyces sp. E1N211 TaxID=1851876 RepID=UPI0012D9BEE0|nr:hypothetical protein [Streptomyces sp. E1N211]
MPDQAVGVVDGRTVPVVADDPEGGPVGVDVVVVGVERAGEQLGDLDVGGAG